MIVRLYRSNVEVGTWVLPWGSQLHAQTEDALDTYEIKISRFDPSEDGTWARVERERARVAR
jgi:hypothetical protein